MGQAQSAHYVPAPFSTLYFPAIQQSFKNHDRSRYILSSRHLSIVGFDLLLKIYSAKIKNMDCSALRRGLFLCRHGHSPGTQSGLPGKKEYILTEQITAAQNSPAAFFPGPCGLADADTS